MPPSNNFSKRSLPRPAVTRVLLVLLAMVAPLAATPIPIFNSGDLRPDATFSWSHFSTTHGAVLPGFIRFPTSDAGPDAALLGNNTTMSIWSAGGLFTPGTLLANSGPDGIFIYLDRPVQGFGLTIEHLQSVQAEYRLDFFGVDGTYFTSVSTPSPGIQGNPTFIGLMDPDSRISTIGVHATPGEAFAVTDPVIQKPFTPETDLSQLPVTATVDVDLVQTATYLHEGYALRTTTPYTDDATGDPEDDNNNYDLLALFPSLRPGDILLCQRLGISLDSAGNLNPPLGVISSTNIIEDGSEFHRVPGAINTGVGFRTDSVKGGASFETPTNIPEDFIIGASSFIPVPAGGRYLFLTRANPEPGGGPLGVRLSHIQRFQFLDWVAARGLHGSLADPDSDFDGDGLTLLEEFAYQKNPLVADAGSADDFAFTPTINELSTTFGMSLAFGARQSAPLTYTAEFSSDLVTWDPVPSTDITPILLDAGAVSRAVFSVRDPAGADTKRFGRIIINYIPPISN